MSRRQPDRSDRQLDAKILLRALCIKYMTLYGIMLYAHFSEQHLLKIVCGVKHELIGVRGVKVCSIKSHLEGKKLFPRTIVSNEKIQFPTILDAAFVGPKPVIDAGQFKFSWIAA